MKRLISVVCVVLVLGAWSCQAPTTSTGSGGDPVAGPTTTGLRNLIAGEGWRTVGDTDQPAFENGWSGLAAFRYREPRLVDLIIDVDSGTPGAPIFTLPADYQPDVAATIPCTGEVGGNMSAGLVLVFAGSVFGLRTPTDHDRIILHNTLYLDGPV